MDESRQLALKTTEDQVKQIRDEASSPSAQRRSSSVRQKFASRVRGNSTKDQTLSMGLSDQDIKAALSLVDESWERQEYRLQQYLQRNHNIANGVPAALDVDDEEFERPDTATSLGRMLEKVQTESTPTAEKDVQLGGGDDAPGTLATGDVPSIQLTGPTLGGRTMAPLEKVGSLEKEIERSFSTGIWSRSGLPS
jgi:hypothetical protein